MSAAARIGRSGWLKGATRVISPNCDLRPEGLPIELIVIHNISLPPGEFGGTQIAALFTNRLDPQAHPYFQTISHLRVSSHFLIRRDGEVMQFVSCNARAWHAGVSSWQGRERCNDFSVGIELEGSDEVPFTAAQYRALAKVTLAIRARYPIRGLAGHEHIAAGRKTDPGPHFDWRRYLRAIGEPA